MVKTPLVYGTTYFIFVLKTSLLQGPTYFLYSQNTLRKQYTGFCKELQVKSLAIRKYAYRRFFVEALFLVISKGK